MPVSQHQDRATTERPKGILDAMGRKLIDQ
jgi:hypothetical protein